MLPREKALVQRLAQEPFALIGIDTDRDLASFKEQCKRQGITWRNSFQGSTAGPLCRAWGVFKFPTLYILDGKGVIRYVDAFEDAFEKSVDQLVAEAKKEAGKVAKKEAEKR